MQLSTWDKEELDAQLANRVQVSKRAVAKVLQAFDRLQQRNDKIWKAIKGEGEGTLFWFYAKPTELRTKNLLQRRSNRQLIG